MNEFCPYDQLGYRPSYGLVDVRGYDNTHAVPVSVKVGRELERDGVPVCWPYASCPAWVQSIGLTEPWMLLHRLFTWPSRWG